MSKILILRPGLSKEEAWYLVLPVIVDHSHSALYNVYPVDLHRTRKKNIDDITITMTGKTRYKVGI